MKAQNATPETGNHSSRKPHSPFTGSFFFLGYLWIILGLGTMLVGCAGTGSAIPESTIDQQYSFWPQFPAEPRIQFLVSFRSSSDIEPPRSNLEELIYGDEADALPIKKPYGVDMANGRIYVCDIQNAGMVVLDLVKKQTRIMGTSGLGGMIQPTDVDIADDGMIYVADIRRGVVFVFNAEEKHVASFGKPGLRPVGLTTYEDELFVCDSASRSVVVMNRFNGDFIRTIGEAGGEDGQFILPLGIAVDDQGLLHVCDVHRCRLQTFERTGEFLTATGFTGDGAGAFVRPKHLDVDEEGVVYVVDASFQNVQMFDNEGRVLMFFGSAGEHPGSMDLPAGFCISTDRLDLFQKYLHPDFEAQSLLVVTNQFNQNKVSVYARGHLRKGVTVQDITNSLAPVKTGVQDAPDTNPAIRPLDDPSPPEQPENKDKSPVTDKG